MFVCVCVCFKIKSIFNKKTWNLGKPLKCDAVVKRKVNQTHLKMPTILYKYIKMGMGMRMGMKVRDRDESKQRDREKERETKYAQTHSSIIPKGN